MSSRPTEVVEEATQQHSVQPVIENSNVLAPKFTPPPGWSTDEAQLRHLAETGFPGEYFDLPGPYRALMYEGRKPFTWIIVRCGGPESVHPNDSLPQYVAWYDDSVEIMLRIDKPKTFSGILQAMHEAAKNGEMIDPYHSCDTTKLEDLYPDSYDPPRYVEVLTDWVLKRESEPVLPASLNGDLYGILPCRGSCLHDPQGNIFIFECLKRYIIPPGLGEEGAERIRDSEWLVKWDQTKRLLQTIERPVTFDRAVYHMAQEERDRGEVTWSSPKFTLKEIKPVEEEKTLPIMNLATK